MSTNKQNAVVIPDGLHGDELREWLSINATDTRMERYTRILTEDEISTCKSEMVRLEMEKEDINDEFTLVKNEFKGKIKEREIECKILRTKIRSKSVEEKGEVYVFRLKEQNRIMEYTPYGDLISNRRMTPEEMQHGLFDTDNMKVTFIDKGKEGKNASNS